MPLLSETNQPKTTENPTNTPVLNPPSKGLFTLPDSVMKLVPWVPFILEATTGQKIPQLGGTMGEIQMALQQLQLTQTQIITNQSQIFRETENLRQQIEQLKTNANQHLSNLTHQFKSLRLTHTKEQKQIEYNNQLEDPNPEY